MKNSDLYQESLLHLALTGVQEFLYWHYGPLDCCWGAVSSPNSCSGSNPCGGPANQSESITVGVNILNRVLVEADEVAGSANRTVLILDPPSSWDSYVLSGVSLPAGWKYTSATGAGTTETVAADGDDDGAAATSGSVPPPELQLQSTAASKVFRFTPRANATVISTQPATFRIHGVPGLVQPVPDGKIMQVVAPCSAAGFWITTSG
jgi:hypothetical protein